MESRELRYFVAVAEELHFGRAAERLGIAQPPLSRAIGQLERRLGAELLHRTSRAVTLTSAGTVLLRDGRAALDALDAAERRARRAAHTTDDRPSIALAIKAGASTDLLSRLLQAYDAVPGSVHVDVVLCGPGEQARLLRAGDVDVAILHRPFDDTDGLDTEDLVTEGQVAILPAGHPLAARETLHVADLADVDDLPPARWPAPDGTYAPGPGPELQSHTQLLQLIALGRTLVLAPESSRSHLRDDVTAVPVVDAPPVTTVIAWPPQSRTRAVADLVQAALDLSPAPDDGDEDPS
ncbi:LysR family transcriptional regulator [Sanguibacter suaedae]|uniref:LysR family transcriptional regulator n=1 Tax=Sanguibacter suaedae TaxID=2795737 RepID=A0A934ID27_9MICO|nr:LysR family transcriptional regulator [Sanguibacter suaedae]MBI9115596.1 LysR family transcriptional regulator [Sanguibacter suaedae]